MQKRHLFHLNKGMSTDLTSYLGKKAVLLRPLALLFCLIIASNSTASEIYQFDSVEQEARYKQLTYELRCLVCQNQNLADSNAELAKDLRKKVYEMLLENKSNEDIIAYMRQRYGDFVLYRPPFNFTTAFLWAGPFLILIITLFMLALHIRKSKLQAEQNTIKQDNIEKRAHIQSLLRQANNLNNNKDK